MNMKLGGGGRFSKLKSELATKGATNPGALAAWIGRRKYGAKKFAALSHGSMMAHQNLGDIGMLRQEESVKVGGFKAGKPVCASYDM